MRLVNTPARSRKHDYATGHAKGPYSERKSERKRNEIGRWVDDSCTRMRACERLKRKTPPPCPRTTLFFLRASERASYSAADDTPGCLRRVQWLLSSLSFPSPRGWEETLRREVKGKRCASIRRVCMCVYMWICEFRWNIPLYSSIPLFSVSFSRSLAHLLVAPRWFVGRKRFLNHSHTHGP